MASICPHFDVAIVKLKEPEKFKAELKKVGMKIIAMELADNNAPMGMRVVAMGFPLGQNTMKLAMGEIAGNQEVHLRSGCFFPSIGESC